MNHLRSDCKAVAETIKSASFDSEDDLRNAFLEIIALCEAQAIELTSIKTQQDKDRVMLSEITEDVDTILGDAQNFLDPEIGARVLANFEASMTLVGAFAKFLEDGKVEIDDINRKQILTAVLAYFEEANDLRSELILIIDSGEEEEDDDGDTTSGDDGDDGDGGVDGDSGSGGGAEDSDTDEEEEGETAQDEG